ncbi:MAG: ThuA domain-containing protein, partial [Aquabacterium sp.]|nr:ThuA domain-containing protein [Ferruginibacter sp.]
MKVPNLLKSVLLFAVVFAAFSFAIKKKEPAVLIFSKTNGYRHQSIPAGIEAIKKLGLENKFTVDATEDSLMFTDANLAKYKAIIFLSPTMDVLGEAQQKAMENYIHKGGGFVGIHAATDCEYNWPWYVKMLGASFLSHPAQQIAKIIVVDKN